MVGEIQSPTTSRICISYHLEEFYVEMMISNSESQLLRTVVRVTSDPNRVNRQMVVWFYYILNLLTKHELQVGETLD